MFELIGSTLELSPCYCMCKCNETTRSTCCASAAYSNLLPAFQPIMHSSAILDFEYWLFLQAGALSDHLIPDPEVPEAEDDEFVLERKAAAKEAAARTCDIRPKWPDQLRRPSNATTFHLYRCLPSHTYHDTTCHEACGNAAVCNAYHFYICVRHQGVISSSHIL